MTNEPIQALLFDLGGVLIEIDFKRAFAVWQQISTLALPDVEAAFTFDEPYAQHERGEISANDYFSHLADRLSMPRGHPLIAAGWDSIFVGEIDQTIAMVESARLPCHIFSNTNVVHYALWRARYPRVVGAVDRVFTSSAMGMRKPERRAFEHIGEVLGLPLASIMFFDDLLENVEGAVATGLTAVLVRGPEDVAHALRRIGALPAI